MDEQYPQFSAAVPEFFDAIDGDTSTPYVSAPSSPGRGTGFYYSAPASPTHFLLSATALASRNSTSAATAGDANSSFEFDFSSTDSMTTADELFFNGKIRPARLQRCTLLSPLNESDEVVEDDQSFPRRRDKSQTGSLHRRTRSMSPDRATSFQWREENNGDEAKGQNNAVINKDDGGSSETMPSVGRRSRRWVFLKEFLYRSKSEGHKEKKTPALTKGKKRVVNNKRRATPLPLPPSASPHELHYTANRAQAEQMRKKTFLPYRQGLLGSLGFRSKGHGAMNALARALNSVTSR